MVASLIPSGASSIPGGPNTIPGAPSRVPTGGDLTAPASVQLRDMKGRFTTGGFGWEWYNLQEFMDMPEQFGADLMTALESHLTELAKEIEEYAQANAPWTDRTGDARDGLKALYIRRGTDIFEIDLGGSVDYQFFLENYNGGEYAIIQPTLREFAPQLMNLVNEYRGGSAHELPGGFS